MKRPERKDYQMPFYTDQCYRPEDIYDWNLGHGPQRTVENRPVFRPRRTELAFDKRDWPRHQQMDVARENHVQRDRCAWGDDHGSNVL